MHRKLRFGMIGGGRGGFIGAVHRIAAQMDAQAELVAGAFSSDPKRSRASGRDFYLDPTRAYGSYGEMARAEALLPSERRLDFIVIVTPNHEHFRPAKLCLELGFNVVCDKPVAFDLAEAKTLRALVAKTGKVFVLTHNYTGNAMVHQARQLVRAGKLGVIRKVVAEYPQGWLATRLEATRHKQASWKPVFVSSRSHGGYSLTLADRMKVRAASVTFTLLSAPVVADRVLITGCSFKRFCKVS